MDGFVLRQEGLTGEVLHFPVRGKIEQAERQGIFKQCEMADDSVVVINPKPMKGGNILEDKTQEMLCKMSQQANHSQKLWIVAKG